MKLFITKKGQKILDDIKNETNEERRLFKAKESLKELAKTQTIQYGNEAQGSRNEFFTIKLHKTNYNTNNRYNTISRNTEITVQNQLKNTQSSIANLPEITEYSPRQSKEPHDPERIAFSSKKDPNCKLEIDDIIPIEIKQPKIRMSRDKRLKLNEHSSKKVIQKMLMDTNTLLTINNEYSSQYDGDEFRTVSRQSNSNKFRHNSNFPSIDGRIRESMAEIKKRQTYQQNSNPDSLSVYHTNYFDSRNEEFIKKQQPKPRYIPPTKSMSFGEYSKIQRNRSISIEKSADEISRERALKELRESKLSEKMIETEKMRNSIIDRIRMKSVLSVYKEEKEGTEHIQEELNWCDQLKQQDRATSESLIKSIFRETMYEKRRKDRLENRIQSKYNNYWKKYTEKTDFGVNKYEQRYKNNSNLENEYNIPAARKYEATRFSSVSIKQKQ